MDNAYTEAINGRFSAQQMASDQVEGFMIEIAMIHPV